MHDTPFLRVMAWGFDDLPERHLLNDAAEGLAEVEYLSGRASLVERVAQSRPAILVVPTADSRGASTGVAAGHAREASPDLLAVMLVTGRPGAFRAIPEAVRAGARVTCASTAAELRDIILQALGRYEVSTEELAQVGLVLEPVTSPLLRSALGEATLFAHEQLTVEILTARMRLPRRTFFRQLVAEGAPLPQEILLWGRVIRASVAAWRREASPFALARAAGFSDMPDLQATCASLLGRDDIRPDELMPSVVAGALRRRLQGAPSPPTAGRGRSPSRPRLA
jgi:hypothetical protein